MLEGDCCIDVAFDDVEIVVDESMGEITDGNPFKVDPSVVDALQALGLVATITVFVPDTVEAILDPEPDVVVKYI